MNTLRQNVGVACITLGLSAFAFSQLGTPASGVGQPFATAPETAPVNANAEGYFVANGASYYTRNGLAFKVEREVSIRVTPSGIIGFDGQALNLAPGQMLTPDGRHAPIPASINIRALPGNANPVPGSPTEARAGQTLPQSIAPVIADTPELQVEPARQR
jgi:hypothetical protein